VSEPLLSIVTINRNDRAGLARTLASVDAQRFDDRELIVVDGASTDGSQEVVRSMRPGLVTTFVSEPDGGIYEAQNKGLALARGTYCLFLNSGDALLGSDVLTRLLAGPPTEDLVYGDVLVEEPWGARRPWRMPDPISLRWLLRSTLGHPAVAIRRTAFDAVGRYDTSLRIAADYRFFLDALVNHGATARRVPVEVAEMAKGGVSTNPKNRALVAEERARVQAEVLSPVLRAHLAEQQLEEARRPGAVARAAFRPVARALRSFGRRLRGRPQ
jgi:glycosyltransferase involved in cell wall biosynthesis